MPEKPIDKAESDAVEAAAILVKKHREYYDSWLTARLADNNLHAQESAKLAADRYLED